MTKRSPSQTELPKTPPTKVTKDQPLLSPSKITSVDEHATVTGLLASLSPIKPSRYFDAELTDGESLIRLVGFDKAKQRQLQPFSEDKLPVTLKDCLIQRNKYNDNLEIVIKPYTKIEESQMKFEVHDLKTAGSPVISLSQLNDLHEHERVTVRVTIVKVYDVQKVGTKTKQDVLVADTTGKATITLWEADINSLQEERSYQLSRLEIREFMGKKRLSFPPASKSIDEISDIESIECNPSSDEDEEQLHTVTVSAIKDLESVYRCINCNKNMEPSASQIITCQICHSTQKLPEPQLAAKLIVHTKASKLTLKANDRVLREIAQSQSDTITPHDILFAPAFTCCYNRYNIITNVSRQ